MKRMAWIVVGWLVLGGTAQAASFDCAKAATKVEKLICDAKKISRLDDELSKLYQDVIGKANAEQKQILMAEQKHWLKHTRNVCGDETCLRLAYWSRQAGLATFFEPKSPLYEHESDKAEAIKQVLATSPFYPSESSDNSFCHQMFDDLKQMKDIRFVDPVVQTQSYEDPALDKWKQHCGSETPPLHFSHGCEPRLMNTIQSYRDTLGTPACSKEFGVPPFKLYELPPERPSGKPRTILYTDDDFGSNVWEFSDSYTAEQWGRVKPKLYAYQNSRFQQVDLQKCKPVIGVSAHGQGDRGSKNYNSIIEYKNQYYVFVLHELRTNYWLDVNTVTSNGSKNQKYCSWSPVAPKPNSSNQGGK